MTGHLHEHFEACGEGERLESRSLLLIVVGAHLKAEVSDRPLAYRLRERVLGWQDQMMAGGEMNSGQVEALLPVVCSDVWYLNAPELQERPAISIGDPAVNAATAFHSNRLPTAFVIENTLRVHLDPEMIQMQACLWGVDTAATASAVDLFVERYLDEFLRAAE